MKQDYHVIWIISNAHVGMTPSELKFIKEQYKKGTGIFIWADNDPLYADANKVLE